MKQLSMNGLKMNHKPLSFYEQYPDVFDGLKGRFPNIFAVSKIVFSEMEMSEAVGGSRSCADHWAKRRNEPGSGSERRAGQYLLRLANSQTAVPETAVPEVKPAPPVSAAMFLVSVPESAKVKADMLMNMMRNIGCEIVDF